MKVTLDRLKHRVDFDAVPVEHADQLALRAGVR